MEHHVGLWLGLYEIELNRHLRRAFRKGAVTLDVGGQFGYDALMASKATGAATYTFECDPSYCAKIRANAERNPELASLIIVEEAFVGDGSHGSLRLDDFVSQRNLEVGAVKIDIEGGELAALHGAESLLSQQRPAVVVEVHTPELARACAAVLAGHGYTVRQVPARRWLPDHRPDPRFSGWLVGTARA
jgi:hypothetical protein